MPIRKSCRPLIGIVLRGILVRGMLHRQNNRLLWRGSLGVMRKCRGKKKATIRTMMVLNRGEKITASPIKSMTINPHKITDKMGFKVPWWLLWLKRNPFHRDSSHLERKLQLRIFWICSIHRQTILQSILSPIRLLKTKWSQGSNK